MQLNPIPASNFQFHFDLDTFTAEMSMLEHARLSLLNRLYDDACDEGFAMVNTRTGKVATFFLEEEHRVDGDITHWTFKPTTETVRKLPTLTNTKVVVYNT